MGHSSKQVVTCAVSRRVNFGLRLHICSVPGVGQSGQISGDLVSRTKSGAGSAGLCNRASLKAAAYQGISRAAS